MQYSFEKDIREKVGPIVVPIGRTVIGVVFGVVLSMLGIGIAWSLFIFFGFESIDVWKGLLYFGAGFGAGTGAFVAWLHLDRESGWVLLLMAAVEAAMEVEVVARSRRRTRQVDEQWRRAT